MSDQAVPAQQEPAAQTTPPLSAADILLAIKENFVVLSAVAALVGVALAMTFFGAYLSVFDWKLIWYVQYTDVLTFGVIAIGVISGSVVTLQSFTQTLLNVKKMDGQKRKRWIIAICLVVAAGAGLSVGTAIYKAQPYWHILLGYGVMGFGLLLIFGIISMISVRTLAVGGKFGGVFRFVLDLLGFVRAMARVDHRRIH
jgi:hypothetical protein